MLWLIQALPFFFPPPNSYVRAFNVCIATVANFTVHFQVLQNTDVFPHYIFLNIFALLSFCAIMNHFLTHSNISHMPFFFSAPNNEIITDPIGIHFCSDLCEELLDWSFTLSTTRGVCCDLVTVYLFYTVSLFHPHIPSM